MEPNTPDYNSVAMKKKHFQKRFGSTITNFGNYDYTRNNESIKLPAATITQGEEVDFTRKKQSKSAMRTSSFALPLQTQTRDEVLKTSWVQQRIPVYDPNVATDFFASRKLSNNSGIIYRKKKNYTKTAELQEEEEAGT